MNSTNQIRRNQLITPYGVGAIVSLPDNNSLMIAGLDYWIYPADSEFLIEDDRLKNYLNVSELRYPPDFRQNDKNSQNNYLSVPAVRFPRWHYCPVCGSMKKLSLLSGRETCNHTNYWEKSAEKEKIQKAYLIPERFIVICSEGHIEDFPIAEWVHQGQTQSYNPITCHIRRINRGTGSSLSNIEYQCSCGARRTLSGAFSKTALENIGFSCHGSKPWLGKEVTNCQSNDFIIAQRTATNVWFGDIQSSIDISLKNLTYTQQQLDKIIALIMTAFDQMGKKPEDNPLLLDQYISMDATQFGVDRESLREAFDLAVKNKSLKNTKHYQNESEYRFEEYQLLTQSIGDQDKDFYSKNIPIEEYDSLLSNWFKSISLVYKLKETRAFKGFSRISPDSTLDLNEKKELLSSTEINWLPATVVYGEGIFFEFNKDYLSKWSEKVEVKRRVSRLEKNYKNSIFGKKYKGVLKPEFVLLHTFAHVLINQLCLDCGYGSAALREKIYCDMFHIKPEMHGVLIYVSSGDSEGSMGGIVRRGQPGKIEEILINAIENARWCSDDPVCINSKGQGPDSCNLAACYHCSLLPETCCEQGNRLLDRGLLIGTLEEKETGFFNNENSAITEEGFTI